MLEMTKDGNRLPLLENQAISMTKGLFRTDTPDDTGRELKKDPELFNQFGRGEDHGYVFFVQAEKLCLGDEFSINQGIN